MNSFLIEIERNFPLWKSDIELVRAERDTHNKWCLLYNLIIFRRLILEMRSGNNNKACNGIINRWYHLISTCSYKRRSDKVIIRFCAKQRVCVKRPLSEESFQTVTF